MRSRHCSLKPKSAGADAVGFGAQAAELHPDAHHQGVVVELTPARGTSRTGPGRPHGRHCCAARAPDRGTLARRPRPTPARAAPRIASRSTRKSSISPSRKPSPLSSSARLAMRAGSTRPAAFAPSAATLGAQAGSLGRVWPVTPPDAAGELDQGAQQQFGVDRLGQIGREADRCGRLRASACVASALSATIGGSSSTSCVKRSSLTASMPPSTGMLRSISTRS